MKKTISIFLALIFILSVIPISAAGSSDYGMKVSKDKFYYMESLETGMLNLRFYFYLNASKSYDITYTAKLFDTSGNVIASWKNFSLESGSTDYSRYYQLTKCNDYLKEGVSYKLRIYGTATVNESARTYYWDYDFTHYPSLFYYDHKDFGMGVSYQFVSYNAGNMKCKLTYSNNSVFDVSYNVNLMNTSDIISYKWADVDLEPECGKKTYTYTTDTVPAIIPGIYTYYVVGYTVVGGIRYGYYWTFVYQLSSDLSAKG